MVLMWRLYEYGELLWHEELFFLVAPTVPSEVKDITGYIAGPVVAMFVVAGIVVLGCWYVYQRFIKVLNGV